MKRTFILLALLVSVSTGYAQYDKNKLIGILTDGSSKAWTVKGVNVERPEKKITFNINMTAQVEKDNGKGGVATQAEKWAITTKDNIRWFINIGNQPYELIVSYAKNGSQYIKLTHTAGGDAFEMNLYPLK